MHSRAAPRIDHPLDCIRSQNPSPTLVVRRVVSAPGRLASVPYLASVQRIRLKSSAPAALANGGSCLTYTSMQERLKGSTPTKEYTYYYYRNPHVLRKKKTRDRTSSGRLQPDRHLLRNAVQPPSILYSKQSKRLGVGNRTSAGEDPVAPSLLVLPETNDRATKTKITRVWLAGPGATQFQIDHSSNRKLECIFDPRVCRAQGCRWRA